MPMPGANANADAQRQDGFWGHWSTERCVLYAIQGRKLAKWALARAPNHDKEYKGVILSFIDHFHVGGGRDGRVGLAGGVATLQVPIGGAYNLQREYAEKCNVNVTLTFT